ncbi:MAG: hypothetical protein L3J41_01580 [Melioribacteraceae bacterium]|nr:hypothetical protein [Melioribacteraceae bacterium]
MKLTKYFLSVLLFSFLLYSCSKIVDTEENPQIKIGEPQFIPVISDSMIYKANSFLVSKVGEQFFNSYIKYDSKNSRFSPADSFCVENPSSCADFLLKPHYYFVYSFKISEKEFVDEIIEFVTDTLGNVVPSRETFGIPNCSDNNCWDNFQIIEKEEAISIAKENGFEDGISDWSVTFQFYANEYNNYTWQISNTLYQSDSESGGKSLIIESNNGGIIKILNWTVTP